MPGRRPRIRSDFTLRLLLEKIVEYGLSYATNVMLAPDLEIKYQPPVPG